jgi:dihydroorotase
MLTRRTFAKALVSVGTGLLASTDTWPAEKPPDPQDRISQQNCDFLIKGGTVIDPGQHLHAPLDVAVKDGKILAVSHDFPESRATQVLSAKGKIVTPGLIDLHIHCFDGVSTGVNADHYSLGRGVTTVVDAGSTGYPMIGTFVKYIIEPSITRIYALVEIGPLGTMLIGVSRYMYDLDWGVNPQLTAQAAEENKPAVVGIKVHLNRDLYSRPEESELVILRKALEAAEASRLPLMVHIINAYTPLPEVLKKMRRGDVFTHCFNGYPNGILDANGRLLPEVREARERGIIFDVAEGLICLSFDVAEKSLQQDFLPDSISTDLNKRTVNSQVFDLPTMVSKFMALGMDLDKVIERVTVKPAGVFDYGLPLGTLKSGSEADISIFEIHEGNFEFVDSGRGIGGTVGKRVGHQKLVNKATFCRGKLFVNEA